MRFFKQIWCLVETAADAAGVKGVLLYPLPRFCRFLNLTDISIYISEASHSPKLACENYVGRGECERSDGKADPSNFGSRGNLYPPGQGHMD